MYSVLWMYRTPYHVQLHLCSIPVMLYMYSLKMSFIKIKYVCVCVNIIQIIFNIIGII